MRYPIPLNPSRRQFFKHSAAVSALAVTGITGLSAPQVSFAAAMTKTERDAMTPAEIVEGLKQGNLRFRQGKMLQHDYLDEQRTSKAGQFPSTVILSCIDSRVPAEIVLDTGIGEIFNTRVAGNGQNDDILGSLEYACTVSGAKVVLVMGHTSCGAIKGAISGVQLGHLTALVQAIRPAVENTPWEGERSIASPGFVDAVARTHVMMTMEQIRRRSPVLSEMENKGDIVIIGAMYSLEGGQVDFFS
jgi:carbonic anhydrase